jgi:predicted transcriptional regulator
MEFGHLSNSLHDNVVGIALDDLTRHVYVLGGTGSGKSTLIRNLYKHLECANYTNTLLNSTIYIDVKDEDAKLFLRQCEKRTFDDDKVTYLDLNHTNFGINLLELPKHNHNDRDSIVSRMVGHVVEMFREFYSQQQTYIQMERILRLLLFYLYSNTDNPSIIDLYDLIVRLQKNGQSELQQILQVYKKVSGPEMKQALDSISTLSKDSWIPLLNRIEMFATDDYLKRKFGVKHTTIDFAKMLMPGNVTIFRVSDTETPKYAHSLAIMAIVIKIWFMVQDRARTTEPEDRSIVVLALDEFQKIKDLSILVSILSQARSYNLGLILSHQNLAQIDTGLLEIILGNTSTQIYGRVSGIDAAKIAKIIDPHFTKELTDQIAVQPDFVFTARTRSPVGSLQTLPLQFRLDMPPKLIIDETETNDFIQKMRKRYSSSETINSDLNLQLEKKMKWIKYLKSNLLSQQEWNILLFLRNSNGNLKTIVEGVQSKSRNETSLIIKQLKKDGLVDIIKSTKIGNHFVHEYALSPNAYSNYFTTDFEMIGTANDINEVATKAREYYLSKGFFVSLVNQIVGKKYAMCDMIAYDYENKRSISVEIESRSEIASHPEQVRFNMIKWKEQGFDECHVWSKSDKLHEIKLKLGKKVPQITIFIINSDDTISETQI